jgi:hypothetical protein
MAQLNFDASRVEPATGMDAIPAGWYNVMVDQSEMKPTRDGAGTRLNIRYVVLDGQYQGRKVFHGLNLQHSNPQTVEIAYKQLSALAHAVGVLQVADSQQLHNIPLKIKVKVRPAEGNYDEQNDITQWKNINEQVGSAPAAPTFGAPAAPGAPAGWSPPPAQAPQAPQAPAGWGAPPAAQQPAQQQWTAPPASPAPTAAPGAPPAGWTPPQNPQPWQQGQPQQGAPAPNAAPAPAPQPQPPGPNPATGAAPPWHRPQG